MGGLAGEARAGFFAPLGCYRAHLRTARLRGLRDRSAGLAVKMVLSPVHGSVANLYYAVCVPRRKIIMTVKIA